MKHVEIAISDLIISLQFFKILQNCITIDRSSEKMNELTINRFMNESLYRIEMFLKKVYNK